MILPYILFYINLLLMNHEEIKNLIDAGHAKEARNLIETALAKEPDIAMLHFLHGRCFMKESRWGEAISCFLKAEAIDPQSPARESREMLCDIMDFYNKDMYNQ